ncbi:type II toxin-antitoxin system prevent-host-death family antitoxin [Bradyrhizobium shewense]
MTSHGKPRAVVMSVEEFLTEDRGSGRNRDRSDYTAADSVRPRAR